MVIVPIALLAAAAVIAGWETGKRNGFNCALLALTLILAGMPFLYQFQPNEFMRTQSNWGLVDGLLAGLVAFATAAVIRSVRLRSIGWAATAACVAAYGLFVKPSGLLIMALIGITWVVLTANSVNWNLQALRDDREFRHYARKSLINAVAVYGVAVIAAFTSAYYSPSSIAFGIRNLKIFHDEVCTRLIWTSSPCCFGSAPDGWH